MRIYLAGPLFTTPERDWNVGLATRLRAGGHDVFVPQENPASERTGRAIFLKDLEGLDWAEGVVAIMDGADLTPARAGNAATRTPARSRSSCSGAISVGRATPATSRTTRC